MPEKLRSSEERTEEAIAEQKRRAEEYFASLKKTEAIPPPADSPAPELKPSKTETAERILTPENNARNFLRLYEKAVNKKTLDEGQKKDLKEAIKVPSEKSTALADEIISSRAEQLSKKNDENPIRHLADADSRIIFYIGKVLRSKVKIENDQIGVFEEYLNSVKNFPGKDARKAEVEKMLEKIAGLKTTETPVAAKPEAEKPKPAAVEKEKPEPRPAKMEILTVGKEAFNKGDRVIYTMRRGEVSGIVQGFKNKKDGNISKVIFLKDGEAGPIEIRIADFIKRNPKKAEVAETPTVEITKPESGDTVVETKLAEKSPEPAEEPPEFNKNEYISDETLGLLGLSNKKIEAAEAPGILRGLDKKRQEVEALLSKETDEEIKKELLEKKRAICMGIIEIESERWGEDLAEKLKEEEQKQLNIHIKGSEFSKRETYEENFRNRYYEDIILKSSLPDKQKKELAKHGELTTQWSHNFFARPFLAVNLNKLEIATLIDTGINVEEIRFVSEKLSEVFTGRIQVGAQKMTKNEFEAFVLEKYNLLEEKIKQATKEREEEIIDKGGIRDFVIIEKANKIIAGLPDDTPEVAPEFSENPDEVRGLKIETSEDQLDKLNQLKYGWEQANKLSEALRASKKIDIGGGEVLDPANSEQRQKIEKEMADFSDEIIKVANEISGSSLRREFWKNKFKEGEIKGEMPTDFEREEFRPELRKWLTSEVQKIYENSMQELKRVKDVSGEKIVLKDIRPPKKVIMEAIKNLPNKEEYISKNLGWEKKEVLDKYIREFASKVDFNADILRELTGNQNITMEDAAAFAKESGYNVDDLRKAMVGRKFVVGGKAKITIGNEVVDQEELQKQVEVSKEKFNNRVAEEAKKRLELDYLTGNLKK